jgi:hypothetical protein
MVVGRLRASVPRWWLACACGKTIFARVSGEAFDRAGEDDAEYLEGLRAAVAVAPSSWKSVGGELGRKRVGVVFVGGIRRGVAEGRLVRLKRWE